MSDIELAKHIFQRCHALTITVAALRNIGVTSAICSATRFRTLMRIAQAAGLGQLHHHCGGRGRGAPRYEFRKHQYTESMDEVLETWGLDPFQFI